MKTYLLWLGGLALMLAGCGGGGGGGSTAQAQTLTTTDGPVMTGVTFTNYEASNELGSMPVASVGCPEGQVPVSAGCYCKISPNSLGHEAGPIFDVEVVGDGAVGACMLGDNFSTGAYGTATVYVTCALPVMATALNSATLGVATVKPLSGAAPNAERAARFNELTAQLSARATR